MTALAGKDANIIWDSQGTEAVITHSQNWTLDVTHDVVEITAMQETWRTYQGGFRDWTATVEQLCPAAGMDISLTVDVGATAKGMGDVNARLELYILYSAGSYKTLYGIGTCTGASVTQDSQDIVRVTYTFQGASGKMTYASGAARP